MSVRVPRVNRWHIQIRIIQGEVIYKRDHFKGMGREGLCRKPSSAPPWPPSGSEATGRGRGHSNSAWESWEERSTSQDTSQGNQQASPHSPSTARAPHPEGGGQPRGKEVCRVGWRPEHGFSDQQTRKPRSVQSLHFLCKSALAHLWQSLPCS